MQRNIQIQDLQPNYIAEIGNTTATDVYGGGFFEGLGDAFTAIYEAGKDFGSTVAETLGY